MGVGSLSAIAPKEVQVPIQQNPPPLTQKQMSLQELQVFFKSSPTL